VVSIVSSSPVDVHLLQLVRAGLPPESRKNGRSRTEDLYLEPVTGPITELAALSWRAFRAVILDHRGYSRASVFNISGGIPHSPSGGVCMAPPMSPLPFGDDVDERPDGPD